MPTNNEVAILAEGVHGEKLVIGPFSSDREAYRYADAQLSPFASVDLIKMDVIRER